MQLKRIKFLSLSFLMLMGSYQVQGIDNWCVVGAFVGCAFTEVALPAAIIYSPYKALGVLGKANDLEHKEREVKEHCSDKQLEIFKTTYEDGKKSVRHFALAAPACFVGMCGGVASKSPVFAVMCIAGNLYAGHKAYVSQAKNERNFVRAIGAIMEKCSKDK